MAPRLSALVWKSLRLKVSPPLALASSLACSHGQPLLHRGPRDLLAQPGGLSRLKGGESRPIQFGASGKPVRAEIR
jgi:hypothetical protein